MFSENRDPFFFRNHRFICSRCQQGFETLVRLQRHTEGASTTLSCDHCQKRFCFDNQLRQHSATFHLGGGIAAQPADLNQPIVGQTPYQESAAYEEVLAQHQDVIKSDEINRTLWKRINCEIDPGFTYGNLKSLLDELMDKEVSVFEINIGFGVILYNTIEQVYKYFYVSNNSYLFEKSVTISNRSDMEKFFEKIKDKNIAEKYFYQRPSSPWVIVGVPNVEIKIYRLRSVPIGVGIVILPKFLKNSRSIINLTHRQGNKKFPYTDNLCLFRCLALHHGTDARGLEHMAQAFKAKLEEFTGKNFDAGVLIEDLSTVEECFNLGINVYDLDDEKMAKVVRLTEREFENSCHLNLFENHFSYIKKLKSYARKYQCGDCKRYMSRSADLIRHKTTCKADEVQEMFVGGKYILSKTVFELCEELNINIPEQDRYDPYFSTFDFESFTKPGESEYLGREFHASQVPATFSVCSNVPENTRAVHVRTYGDSQQLVDRLIIELLKHQEKRKEVLTEKYQQYLDALDQMEKELKTKLGIQDKDQQKSEDQKVEEEIRGKRKQPSFNKTNNKKDNNGRVAIEYEKCN